jgi:hypothetical protein
MKDVVMLSPVKINVRPYPVWERFRVAFECIVYGEVSFQGEITDIRSAPPTNTSPRADSAEPPGPAR